jgi:hypothetical protein
MLPADTDDLDDKLAAAELRLVLLEFEHVVAAIHAFDMAAK